MFIGTSVRLLGVECHEEDIVADVDVTSKRAKRLTELKQYTSDLQVLDNVDCVAFNQEELKNLID